jgi:hypothetical protein
VIALAVVLITFVGMLRADVVTFRDKPGAKTQDLPEGKILAESSAGVKVEIKMGKDTITKTIPASQIHQIAYKTNVSKLDFRKALNRENNIYSETTPKKRTETIITAIELYGNLAKEINNRPEAVRFCKFKVAELTVLLAQGDATKMESAIKGLVDFKNSNPDGWTILPALKLLARTQEENGKEADASKTYEELANLPGAPAELARESSLLVSKMLLRGGKAADAKTRLEKLAADASKGEALEPFIRGHLVESKMALGDVTTAEKDLLGLVRENADTRVRALGYNLLGDYYRVKGQNDDAFWAYLRVDAQFNEDPEEHAKALYYLAKLFDSAKKNPIRGEECLTQLLDKRLDGTVFQRKARLETKPKSTK